MKYQDSSEQAKVQKKLNSILKHSSTYVSHNSDDSDSEEDEKVRRKYINLKSGHGMLISSTAFSTHLDLSKSVGHDKRYYEDLLMYNVNTEHKGNDPLKYKKSISYAGEVPVVPPLDLDLIQMNNDFEYGFNPKRLTGSKAGYTIRLRPLSLYSPQQQPQKPSLRISNSDAIKNYKSVLSDRPISHASNDLEHDLEKEMASIRSQPCNLEFQGCKGKVNQKQVFAQDLASSRRNRKIRRHLSFDSHPKRKWQKTLSLDSGLENDPNISKVNNDKELLTENETKSQSQTLLDKDESDCFKLKDLKNLSFSAEYILDNNLTPVSTPDDDVDEKITLQNIQKEEEIRIVPKFVDMKPPVEDILVSTNGTSYSIEKQSEKNKRRNIPHILSAFRLPNKKLMKLIKKKPSEGRHSPMKVPRNDSPVILLESKRIDDRDETGPEVVASIGQDNESFSESVNTFEQSKEDVENATYDQSYHRKEHSQSTHSLQKVDEDKESLEFQSPFSEKHRSKSTCSFTTNKDRIQGEQSNRTSRRLSDTGIPFSEKHPPTGHSPSKRFIRKLFSPVVCGLPSPDKQRFINGSLISLGSYDSGSIISESDDSYPQLFDFGSHELMEEMTMIDKELMVRIPWDELSILGWMSPEKNIIAPNIMKMVEFFNRVVMMVTTSILTEENLYRRSKAVQKAIKLALKFRYQRNYNSLKAVLTGLQCTPVFRLKQTWKQVPSRYKRVFRELSELMSEEDNFYNYRVELLEAMNNPPCIPFLGNFLTTVVHMHALASCNLKYKDNSKKHSTEENNSESDSCLTSPILSPTSQKGSKESVNKDNELHNQVDPCLRSSTSKIHSASHMRTDSDDSGVVLNVHRTSRSSDDLEPSPRDNSGVTDSFKQHHTPRKHYSDSDSNAEPNNSEHIKRVMSTQTRHRRSVSEIIVSPSRHGRSVSVNDFRFRNAIDIASVINSRPIAREDNDDLYRCELQFWKYQIAAIQYRIIPKPYIRRYLMNSPYNTEEENYKLSLAREPPSK